MMRLRPITPSQRDRAICHHRLQDEILLVEDHLTDQAMIYQNQSKTFLWPRWTKKWVGLAKDIILRRVTLELKSHSRIRWLMGSLVLSTRLIPWWFWTPRSLSQIILHLGEIDYWWTEFHKPPRLATESKIRD
jgi:hypothetical protein